jgi:hypothetical protein
MNPARLKRLEVLFAPPPDDAERTRPALPCFESREAFLDWLSQRLPDYLEAAITGDADFARTLDAFDGRLSQAAGFHEAFSRYWRHQYENFGRAGTMYLFPPLDPNTECEQARRKVVQMIREQLQKSPDNVDILIAEVLADDAMLRELNRRHDSIRLARCHQ